MKKRQTAALLLSIMLCLFMFFSVAFVIAEFDHQCTGESCQICVEIEACVSLINHLGLSFGCALAVILILPGFTAKLHQYTQTRDRRTPVSLKVKLII